MALTHYHAKRDFKLTPEPRGRPAAQASKKYKKLNKIKELHYLIQKHAASRLHYDFRLELNGVLLSWAVPKGPSLNSADKRLAMHVEDHPLEYGNFEGTIPKGQYGGGTVMLWDRGTWSPVDNPAQGFKRGHLKFDLHGEKLQGRWALVKTHGSKYGGSGEPWLLIKDNDRFARRGRNAHVVDEKPDSVVSSRTIEEIAAAADRQWQSGNSQQRDAKKRRGRSPPARTTAALPGAGTVPASIRSSETGKRAAMPARIAPTLATLVKAPPQGDGWIHEVKYDGYRMVCRLDKGKARIFSRNGRDWTAKLPALAAEIKCVKAVGCWLDGELCAIDDKGRSDFQSLQNALSEGGGAQLVYFVFDLLYLDGRDLRDESLATRKSLLRGLLESSNTDLRYSPDVRGSGPAVLKKSCPMGLEGIVCKRADSTYSAGARTRDWLKVKCLQRQEMVIGGFTDPQGGRIGLGALLLGYYERGKLRYAGKVGTGFDDRLLENLRRKLDAIEVASAPFVNPPRGAEARRAHWVSPKRVAEIQFTEWSESGALRHPVFMGLRDDKKAREVLRERPLAVEAVPAASARALTAARLSKSGSTRKAAHVTALRHDDQPTGGENGVVAGIKLTHANKLLFPESHLEKQALARYYEATAKWILPHMIDRPLSLYRCPDGWRKTCFFQKHADRDVHDSVSRVSVPDRSGKATYFAVSSPQALVALVQWGVVELHPWGATTPHLEKPDRLIFDLDPDDKVPWQELVAAVKDVRALLTKLGLQPFLKTTGGKGMHVVVPIRPTLTWDQAKHFTKAVADLFARTFPDRFVATASKVRRRGKIFIDYLRNAEGATAVAPYSVRARHRAPVSMPIRWNEFGKDVRFDFFNVKTVPSRLKRLRVDPWAGIDAAQRVITSAMFNQVGAKR